MKQSEVYSDLKKSLKHDPTEDQDHALQLLSSFILERDIRKAFVLRGYAGTGKTTLMSTLPKVLLKYNRKVKFLAPTGRAAKVLSLSTKRRAYTIHKHIYTPTTKGGKMNFVLKENEASNTLFVIDEASMIGEDLGITRGQSLLEDLISFVQDGVACNLLFVGDIAQLPPVGERVSAALSKAKLEAGYNLEVTQFELKQVVRQAQDSGILANATYLRNLLPKAPYEHLSLQRKEDFLKLEAAYELEDFLTDSFLHHRDDSVILTRTNKRSNQFNQDIRSRILQHEGELAAGEILMAVKNNYHWLDAKSQAGFIANGDLMEVKRIVKTEEKYGYKFATVEVAFLDYPGMPDTELIIWLDALHVDAASLPYKETEKLYQQVSEEEGGKGGHAYKRLMKIRNHPYLNAVQVKYAYAVTCHKAQGGQWKRVFIEKGYLPNSDLDLEYLRWLYTAFTRASEQIYLIGFGDEFFTEQA